MDFEWDDDKSEACLRERGFDFGFAALIFDGPTMEATDTRQDYGEVRVNAVGVIDGDLYHVTYTDRDDVRRIISARRAHRKERKAWHASASQNSRPAGPA